MRTNISEHKFFFPKLEVYRKYADTLRKRPLSVPIHCIPLASLRV